MDKKNNQHSKIIGWREWVALPELGIPALKGKIDTGAKTSSLHAFDIHLVTEKDKTIVYFKVHPFQDLTEVISCKALLVDRRWVSDSGGHKEERLVVKTSMVLGGVRKKIELTLTNRQSMKYRMLIGRSALKYFYIDPTQSYLSGKTLKQKRYLKGLKLDLDSDEKDL